MRSYTMQYNEMIEHNHRCFNAIGAVGIVAVPWPLGYLRICPKRKMGQLEVIPSGND